ncbi:MAG: 16S rRNA (cytosine(967)-C(5))-methyltransferase RsmB [Steroidobacteraceae bacterium]
MKASAPAAKAGTPAPGAVALAQAAQAVHAVRFDGVTAEEALTRLGGDATDLAATRAILSGSLRWYLRLAPLADTLLRPGQLLAPPLHSLLVTALHQLEYSRAPAPVVVNIAVDAARVLNRSVAAGLVNALLRRFLAAREELCARVARSDAAELAHPRWLLREIRSVAGAAADAVIAADNEAPPMSLRVNLARGTRADFLARCAAAGIGAQPGLVPTAVVLDEAVDVRLLPGFAHGEVSVQDAGAQHAAVLLDARPGERVLDACAAPGGKAGHILERTPEADLVALDVAPARLARVQENLDRLGVTAELVAADLAAEGWWDGRPFDRVLLDAPCSATGVIRRHPDIKLLRRASDITGFATTQQRLLQRCAQLLAPGGRLVYATCSILAAENEAVVEHFLAAHPDWSRAAADLRLLPAPRAAGAAAVTDGFYYACLTRGVRGP